MRSYLQMKICMSVHRPKFKSINLFQTRTTFLCEIKAWGYLTQNSLRKSIYHNSRNRNASWIQMYSRTLMICSILFIIYVQLHYKNSNNIEFWNYFVCQTRMIDDESWRVALECRSAKVFSLLTINNKFFITFLT